MSVSQAARSHASQDLSVAVETGPTAARTALELLETELAHLCLEDEELGAIKIVIAEALNNVMEHAFAPPSPQGQINVACSIQSTGLHFRISDNGAEMPDGSLPLGEPQQLDVDMMDLPEGGFGWFLIRELAKDVCYERQGDDNVLTLRMAIFPG